MQRRHSSSQSDAMFRCFRFLATLHVFLLAYAASARSGCPVGGWLEHRGSCLRSFQRTLPWEDARTACLQQGADLVRIDSDDLQTFINSQFLSPLSVWIGLNDRRNGGTFAWLDDVRPTAYTHWNPGEPNNAGEGEDCVALLSNGFWNDQSCAVDLKYICQKTARPVTTTAVVATSLSTTASAVSPEFPPSTSTSAMEYTPDEASTESAFLSSESSVHSASSFIGFPTTSVGSTDSTSTGVATVATSCPRVSEDTPYGRLTWPQTEEGGTASLTCPYGTDTDGFLASRQCARLLLKLSWRPSHVENCRRERGFGHELRTLVLQPINASNAHAVARDLMKVTRKVAAFSQDDVTSSVNTALVLLGQPAILESRDAVVSMVTTFSDLLSAPHETVTSDTGVKLLEAIDVLNRGASLRNGSLVAVQPRLALVAVALTPGQPFAGFRFSASTPDNSSLSKDKVSISNTAPSNVPEESDKTTITLPPNLLTSLPAGVVTRITFALFQNDNLFEVIGNKTQEDSTANDTRFINSHVIAASVPGFHLQNLTEPVIISLQHRNMEAVRAQCVFWEMTTVGGHWSGQGCEVKRSGPRHTVCACNHLTNFALLMDVYQTGNSLSEADKRALSLISYIGCGVSLVGLLITLLTFTLFRTLRKGCPPKLHMNLCLALALCDVIFLVGMQSYTLSNPAACKAVAVMLHFSLLSAMAWMTVEAFYIYLALVVVFNTYTDRLLLKCSLFALGVPFIVVVLTLGINRTDNYGLQNGGICWLGGAAFYGAFAGPVLLLLAVNLLGFGLAMHRMLSANSASATRRLTPGHRAALATQLRGALGVLSLLGLTWIFAIFAIGGASVVFNYLFAIFNSLQGLFIFIFYCLLKKDARAQWLRLLTCWRCKGAKLLVSHSGTSSHLKTGSSQGERLTSATWDSTSTHKNASQVDSSRRESRQSENRTESPPCQSSETEKLAPDRGCQSVGNDIWDENAAVVTHL